ncbi:MAG: hypothetical protein M3N31_05130 [Actinomycetota bacterium]|nr:hypothetical protein [Actinomycetota bacterium]
MTLLLVVLVIALAAAGGFLGDLLEVAGWALVLLMALGAAVGLLLYRWAKRVVSRWR